MTHLSPEQIVDVADGCADAALAAHARVCDGCRANVDAVLEAWRLAQSDPPPEPSPLFWPHLAARIGRDVRRTRVSVPFWRSWGWRLAPLGALAILVVAVAVGARMWPPASGSEGPAAGARPGAPAQAGAEPTAEGEPLDDPSWTLVSVLSADVSVEDAEASGVLPPPGGTDKALLQLDGEERAELARILREEIGARAALDPQDPGA